MAEQTPTKTTKTAKELFTIVDTKTRAVFVSQPFTSQEAANGRLEQLKEKFKKQYTLAVARVDERGGVLEVIEEK